MKAVLIFALASSAEAFRLSKPAAPQISTFQTNAAPKKSGANFNYDASNYQDSKNEGNYRRLSDRLAAAKAEDEQLMKEREEILRKEQMAAMILKQEMDKFQNTPGETVVATSDVFSIPPTVLQVIDDLDNELIGLKSVSYNTFTISFSKCKKHYQLNYHF